MTTEQPDNIEQLKKMLAMLQHENQVLNAKNKDLENRLNIALEQLQLNRNKQFGQRSEKMPKLSRINPRIKMKINNKVKRVENDYLSTLNVKKDLILLTALCAIAVVM
jgi:regulator of replication initiation timing